MASRKTTFGMSHEEYMLYLMEWLHVYEGEAYRYLSGLKPENKRELGFTSAVTFNPLFLWDRTPQGFAYWSDMDMRIPGRIELKAFYQKSSMIQIGNKRNGDIGEYVGRGTPLGNPYIMHSESERDKVCDLYENSFPEQMSISRRFREEVIRLKAVFESRGSLKLICWCAPKRCHAETIKKAILGWNNLL